MKAPLYPSLFQANTRVWLTALSRRLGRPATLDDLPDAELDHLAEQGFDWLWLLSVWRTGPEAQAISRAHAGWRSEFAYTLPDLCDDDIGGSGFAITGYSVSEALGGDDALARLRARLQQRGLKLMLDFVPNHMGLGHPWVHDHPEYFVAGSEESLAQAPQNFTRAGGRIIAHGRDPYFDGWPDTLQINYANPAAQQAMALELERIAGQCDGVRCDMAMLVLPDVFARTWGLAAEPFWPMAIPRVRHVHADFCFMAEVYWDREWELQQQGFDFTYDKRLYDRLREGCAQSVRGHFWAGLDYQNKLARFLENHDEPRAAATFSRDMHRAAAALTFLSPGLRFFHQGQFEGRQKRISPHLVRGPEEPCDEELRSFYGRLLAVLRQPALRAGRWQLLACAAAWPGNGSHQSFVAFAWEGAAAERYLVVVNYSASFSQCYLHLPFADLEPGAWRLQDQLGSDRFDRDGSDLQSRGLYLDMRPWQAAAYELRRLPT